MKDAFGVSKGLPSIARHKDGHVYTGGVNSSEAYRYISRRGDSYEEGLRAAKEMSGLTKEQRAQVRERASKPWSRVQPDFTEPRRTPTGRTPKKPQIVPVEPVAQKSMHRATGSIQEGRWRKFGTVVETGRDVGYRNGIEAPALLKAARKIKIRRIP